MNRTRHYIILGALLIVGLFVSILWYADLKKGGRENYIHNVAKAVHAAQESYAASFNAYADELEQIGLASGFSNVSIYTNRDQIPAVDLNKISEDAHPGIHQKKYKILFKYKDNDQKETFWVLTEDGKLTEVRLK